MIKSHWSNTSAYPCLARLIISTGEEQKKNWISHEWEEINFKSISLFGAVIFPFNVEPIKYWSGNMEQWWVK